MIVITFGRSSQNTVVINDNSVSRIHCQIIQYDDGSFAIIDFDSTNGSFVNDRKIVGEVRLNRNDAVRIGNVNIHWQAYFAQKKDNTLLSWALGALGLASAVVLILLFAMGDKKNKNYLGWKNQAYRISFNYTELDFGMNLGDIRRANPNARIEKKTTPGFDNELESAEGYNYYNFHNTNNERTAVFTLENNIINSITILDKAYSTSCDISIGSTWENVVNAYPDGEWWIVHSQYDFYTYSYEHTWIYYYVPSTCTSFVFKGSQFSELQMRSIYQAVEHDKFSASAISSSVYASIASSITVYSIVLNNCSATSNQTFVDFTGHWATSDFNFQLSLQQTGAQISGTTHSNDHGGNVSNIQYALSGSVSDNIVTVGYYSDYWEQNMKGRIKYLSDDQIEWMQIPQKGRDMPGKTILYRYAPVQSVISHKERELSYEEMELSSSVQTKNTDDDLIGSQWVYSGDCFGSQRYEVLEIQESGIVKITINNDVPYYGEYVYTGNRKEMSFLWHLQEHKGTRFYIRNDAIYFSDNDWNDAMFETCDHKHKIFKRIDAVSHKSEDRVAWTFSIPFDYSNYKNNIAGELLLPDGKRIQYDFYVSDALGSTAFDKLYFYSTSSETTNLIYQYDITLIRPNDGQYGRKYYGGRETNWAKGVETQSFDTKEWKNNRWNKITVEVTR